MSIKPISPKKVAGKKKELIPDAVIEIFNELIIENYSNGYASINQQDVLKRLVEEKDLDQQEIFAQGWLDIEGIYEKAGWAVDYDKPGYNETYSAVFKFSKK